MKNTLSFLIFLSLCLITVEAIAQCPEAENYVSKIQQADSWSPTERASSGKKISAWTQLGNWYNYRCECENGGTLSDEDIKGLVDHLNLIKGQIAKEYSAYGSVPNTSIANCKKKGSSNSNGLSSGKSSTQIEMENRFRNYNNAVSLKEQGENIAKAYAQQVKSYGELNSANTPEALLQNFNNNMQAIADLQTQNKADNLNQLTNTLSSTINDLSSGNHEGALFSTLSLLDQGEAKREARREAERVQQNLIFQTQEKMTTFYMKAAELNDQAIKQYNEKAAYTYNKEEETYLLEYVSNLECHKKAMKTNFSYSNTSWTQNRCAIPEKKNYTVNNLIAKDIQYINAAKRKYALYEKTGEPIFQKGAMRFAGLAATENPKADYYYLMGHFAGINNPLVAYSSFLTAKAKNSKYFTAEKASEYSLIKLALEASLKIAIDENDQEIIKNIVGANLHRSVTIDGSSPVVYAIKIDQASVVYAFLNTELEGQPQIVITNKVQEVISMAAILDAPKTIQKFVDLGFEVDFSLNGTTPIELASNNLSENAYTVLLSQSKITEKHIEKFKNSPINILLIGKNDPISAGKKIDNEIADNNKLQDFVNILVSKSVKSTNCYYILGNSLNSRKLINNKSYLKNTIQERLVYEITHSEVKSSKAADIISSGILEYEKVPTLGDLLSKSEYLQAESTLSKEKEIDFILDFYKESLIQIKNIAVSEYYTQKTKDDGIAGIENEVKRLSTLKANISNITEKQRKEISTIFFSTLGSSEGYFDLKRKYYDFYLSTLKKEESYTMTEKFNISIEYLEETLSKLNQETQKAGYDATIWTINNLKNNLEKVNELSTAEIQAFNKTFATFYLLPSGKELDAESLRFLLLENYIEGEDSYLRNDYSIALIAFKKEDAKLFKAIDKHYDMNSAFNSDGSSLLTNMLSEGSLIRESYIDWKYDRKIKVEKAYLSKDFNFNKKIGESYPIEILLQNAPINTVGQTEDFFAEDLKDITEVYNVDFNKYYPQLNGTILHWYVARLVNESTFPYYNSGLGEFIKNLDVDKSIVNDENLTAYQLYVNNKKNISKKVVKNDGSIVSSDTFFKSILK